jgi:hypothetical protein
VRTSLRLSGLRLAQAEGEPIALGSLWRERPVALFWVRHFG